MKYLFNFLLFLYFYSLVKEDPAQPKGATLLATINGVEMSFNNPIIIIYKYENGDIYKQDLIGDIERDNNNIDHSLSISFFDDTGAPDCELFAIIYNRDNFNKGWMAIPRTTFETTHFDGKKISGNSDGIFILEGDTPEDTKEISNIRFENILITTFNI